MHPLAQGRDVRGVVPSMPLVQSENAGEREYAPFGMIELAFEVGVGHVAEQVDPTALHGIEQGERYFDGRDANVGQLSPELLVVGLDAWLVLRQRELETAIRVQMAVGDMVHDLPNSPAVVTVRRVELRFVEPGDGATQVVRRALDLIDERMSVFGVESNGGIEPADGVAEGFHGNLH